MYVYSVYLLCIYQYTHTVNILKIFTWIYIYILIYYINILTYHIFLKYIHACVCIYIYIINIHYTLYYTHVNKNVSGYSHNPCSLNRERDTALNASGTPSAWPSLSPYRITPIHWLMARRRLWRNDVVRSYWRTRHPLLRFLCRKEPCRQREELGSKNPIQRTRVTRVTWDVLFHR